MAAISASRLKVIFWVVFAVSLMLVEVAAVFTSHWADRAFYGGAHVVSNHISMVAVPMALVAFLSAYGVCKRLGAPVFDSTKERLERPPEPLLVQFEDVELRITRGVWSSIAIAMDILALVFVALVHFLPSVPGTSGFAYIANAFFFILSLGFWYCWLTRIGFVARLNAEGVRADVMGKQRLVMWDQIGTCEITKLQNAISGVTQTRFSFYDSKARPLITVETVHASKENLDRFEHALRRAFRNELTASV